MKNVTATMRALADLALVRGESMASIPTDKLAELVDHLRAVDRLVVAAETFAEIVGTPDEHNPWSDAECEGFEYLRNAVKAVAS